jgi:signal peptidase I
MAEKTEKVVTTTTTVTTTTVTETTEKKKKSGWWSNLKTAAKIALFLGIMLVLASAVLLIVFGRAKNVSNTMDGTIAKNSKVYFNRFKEPQTMDIAVFRHPETDSVVPTAHDKNYYKMCRMYGPNWCSKNEVVFQKLKRRPIYLSRIYGAPGNLIEIKDNVVYLNNAPIADPETAKYPYVVANDRVLSMSVSDSLGLKKEDMTSEEDYAETFLSIYRNRMSTGSNLAIYSLDENSADKLSKSKAVSKVEKIVLPKDLFEPTVFPYLESKHWNQSNFGPLVVPQKGKVLKLSTNTLPLYRRCIEAYEGNKVEVKDGKIFINGAEANSYRFKKNYYFVLSDNRSSKDDSRYFGFVPDDHILGVACK